MELALGLIFGMFAGMIAGILPGLGVTSTLILTYPFIKSLDPVGVLCFYVALACSVQYFGSVVGIYLGVPGETTSLISSKVGFKLMSKGQGNSSLGSTAIASLFAALVASITLYFVLPHTVFLMPLLSFKIQGLVLIGIILMLIYYGSNSAWLNICLISLGIFLSMIGYNTAGISITFGADMFTPGLNSGLVLLMLFVVPNLLMYWNTTISVKSVDLSLNFAKSFGWAIKRWTSIIRGTVVGMFTGLIPGIGPIISSNIAAQIEQRFSKKPSAELISAEAANNSSIIICFIPFFALGLTIMAHEAVVNDILLNKSVLIDAKWLQGMYGYLTRLDTLTVILILANVISFIIAWPACRSLILFYKYLSYKTIVYIVLASTSMLTFYQSYYNYRLDLDALTFIVLLPLTALLTKKRIDTMPLMFAFLLGDSVVRILLLLKDII